jgi:hypothetical protein
VRRRRRLLLEVLEDRVVPVTNQIDLGGLRFLANTTFSENTPGNFSVLNPGDSVEVGFAPSLPVTVTALGQQANGQVSSLTVQGLTPASLPTSSSYTLEIDGASYTVSTVTPVQGGGYQLVLSTPIPASEVDVGTNGTFVIGDNTFEPLLQFVVQKDASAGNKGSVTIQTLSNSFEVLGAAEMDLKISKHLKIWQQTDAGDDQVFNINNLLGYGQSTPPQSLDPTHSTAITVADWVDFQLSGLVLSQGDGTSGPEVGMQGDGSISSKNGVDLGPLSFLKDLDVKVAGSNYVWASKNGKTVTGFEGELTLPTKKYEIGGYNVTGKVDVGYSDFGDGNGKRVTIGGMVQLQAPDDAKVKLENVGGTIALSFGSVNGAPKFYGVTLEVNGTFEAGGLKLTTLNDFGFSYNVADTQWEVFGGVEFTLKDKATVDILLGTATSPGLVVKDGTVKKFNGTLNADFELGPVVITTSPSDGANFTYDGDKGEFEMSGGVGIQIGKGDTQFRLAARLGDATDPGIIYIPDQGGLQQVDLGITGTLAVKPVAFTTLDAGFRWVKATTTAPESWEIFGSYEVDFKAFKTSVELGTQDKPGIKVDENGLVLDGIKVEVDNVSLGKVANLQQVVVAYQKDGNSFDLDVECTVYIVGGITVHGEVVVIDGKAHSVSLSIDRGLTVPIPGTGLVLTEIGASITNIDDPANIVVTGKVGVVFAKQFNLFGKEATLFHAEGDVTIDRNEFILDCTVQVGAYSTDGGVTWQGLLGTGEGRVDLNWNTNVYSLHLEANKVFQVFDIKADLVFAEGKDIALLAQADVVIPSWVPFVGGDKIAGVGFFFEHVWAHGDVPTSTTFAAWLNFDLFTDVTVGFEVVIDGNGNATWGFVGGSEVAGFRQVINPVDGNKTYTYSVDLSDGVPDGTTRLLAKVDWSRSAAGVSIGTPRLRVQHTVNGQTTTYTEDQFAANGIKVINDARMTNGTSKVIQITNNNPSDPYAPLQGTYTLLVDVDAQGGNPFPSFPGTSALGDDLDIRVVAHSANPIFGDVGATTPYQLNLPTAPTNAFTVSVAGNADEQYLQKGQVYVSLYRISSDDPYRRPVFIQKVLAKQTDPNGVTAPLSAYTAGFVVPIDGLDASAYTLIAVVDDGTNPPVATDPSPAFTPVFAVRGTVANQNGTPITGLPVFLDYNRNGIQDANEPSTTTGPNGYAFPATFDSNPNLAPVPVGSPFDVVLASPSNPVPDSGFEVQDVTNERGGLLYSPANSPWTFTSTQIPGDGAGLAANGSNFGNPDAPEGTQAAFLQRQGSISQMVSLAVGTYTLSFLAAQRPGDDQTFQVLVDGIVVDSFQPVGTSYESYTTASFTVTAGSHKIEFLGTNSNSPDNSADTTAFLDGVRILTASNSVPDSGYEFQDVTKQPGGFLYSPVNSPWTFTSAQIPGDGAGLAANGSDFGNANAPEGNQAAFLQRKGSISQTVSLAAGTYRISFMAAQRPGDNQTFQVWVRDSSGSSFLVGSFQPAGTSYQAYTTDSFPLAAGSYTIEFLGTNSNSPDNSADNTAFLDAVRCDKVDPFAPAAPTRVTFDGTNTVNQPFALAEHAAIKGVVYNDTNSNGNPAAGQPVGGALVYLDTNGNGLRDPGEPTAVTDANGVYSFSGLAAGTYTVRVDMTTVGHITPAEAYVVPAGTAGTETGAKAANTTYGMAFTTAKPVVITSLGVFDDNSDGLTTTLTAVLYDATTKVELARLTFTPQNPGRLVGGTRYLDLPNPITLPAGFQGMIVAYGFGATTDLAGRNPDYFDPSSSVWTTDGGAGRLTFTGGYLANTLNTFPTIPDHIETGAGTFLQVFGLPNPYAAGSFLYRDVPWAASPSSATSYQVSLDASGTELLEGRNFGLLPPTLFFGQVTGSVPVNGKSQAVPQSGVPVGLLADRVVVAIDSGGSGGAGFTPDQHATNGTVISTTTDIDTSGVPSAPAADIYQTARVGDATDAGGRSFTYTLGGLSPGSKYTVRLHFAEIQYEVAGQRKFDVAINGTRVLTDFDIIAAAGGPNTAIFRGFQATADVNGQIVVDFTDGSTNTPPWSTPSRSSHLPTPPRTRPNWRSTPGAGAWATSCPTPTSLAEPRSTWATTTSSSPGCSTRPPSRSTRRSGRAEPPTPATASPTPCRGSSRAGRTPSASTSPSSSTPTPASGNSTLTSTTTGY